MAIKRISLASRKIPHYYEAPPSRATNSVPDLIHDLRTRLNHVIGYCEIVVDGVAPLKRTDLLEDLAKVRSAAIQLNALLSADLRLPETEEQPLPAGWMPLRIAASGPLNQIIGYSEILDEETLSPGLIQYRSDIQQVTSAGNQFWNMVQGSSLAVSRQEALRIRQHHADESGVARYDSTEIHRGQPLGNILVVDDEAINRDVLQRRLERSGYRVDAAPDAATAVGMLRGQPYDLLLLDILMPDKDGFEFLVELRNDPYLSRIPVIMLSALADVDRVAGCIEAGAEDYLTKPFNGTLLRARIGACLEKKRLRDSEIATLHQLHAETERLAVTFGSIADAVITTDNAGRITLMNEGAYRLVGSTAAEAIGAPFEAIFRLFPTGANEPIQNVLEIVIERCAPVRFSAGIEIETPSGTRIPVALRAAPLRSEDGLIRGVAVVAHDITEREQLAQEMLRSSKLESLSLLAGGIAHEYNNILTAMFGQLSLALTESPSPKIAGRLRETEKSVLRAKDLTRQLLTFAKGGDPVRRNLRIEEIIRPAAEFAIRSPGVRCEFEFTRDIPSVLADPDQISQVIHNIVLNSEQAMRGAGVIRVKVRPVILTEMRGPLTPGSYVQITVSDEGPGIPKESLGRIFDPFFTTKPQSSGLGLSAAHSIIRKHHGFIEVEPEAPQGAAFRVWLPVGTETPEDTQLKPISKGKIGGRILVMDDEEAIRSILKEMLSIAGYEVELAETGEQALRRFGEAKAFQKPFDAIILDLIIPNGMGGRETILKIRERDTEIPVLVSSGYSTDPVMARFRDFGFSGVLPKPYRMQDMLDTIAGLIRTREESVGGSKIENQTM